MNGSALGHQLVDLGKQHRLILFVKAGVHMADDAFAIDNKRGRHGADVGRCDEFVIGIARHREEDFVLPQEACHVLLAFIHADADHAEAMNVHLLVPLIEDRQGCLARCTSGGPEVEVDHLAFRLRQRAGEAESGKVRQLRAFGESGSCGRCDEGASKSGRGEDEVATCHKRWGMGLEVD